MENNTQNRYKILVPFIALLVLALGAYAYFTSEARQGIERYEDKEIGIRFKFPSEWKVYKNEVGNIYYLFKESEGEVTDIAAEVIDKGRTNIVVEVADIAMTEDAIKEILNPSEFEIREMNQLNVMRFVSTGFEAVSTTTKPRLTYALSSPFEGKRSIWITLHPYSATSTAEIEAAEQIALTFDITKRTLPSSDPLTATSTATSTP